MKQELERLLAQNDTFMVEGVLNKNKLAELARQYNPELLNILMSNDKISKYFFSILDTGVLVFKKDVFLQFLNNKEFLPDSFTAYKTKIGLATGDKYLSENQEVVLNFPYKDCVLEGGQTKDDAKRQEIFFNETLAPTEINRLLDDKVLTNFKCYDETGEHEVEELSDTDNLIIKGNNLIALHSLKKRFAGKVKLIYIDPPYNTGSDSFGYNDSFNRSTWLTFMKNRLSIAKDLLENDGILIVQISFHEFPYLRVMMDELFTEENHKMDVNVLVRHPQRSLTSDKEFNDVLEYALIYSKSENFKLPKQKVVKTIDDYQYDFDFPEIPHDSFQVGDKTINVYLPDDVTIVRGRGHIGGLKSMSIRGSIREKNSSGRFYVAHLEKLIAKYPEGTIFTVPDMGDDGRDFRIFELPKNGNKNGFYYPGKPLGSEYTLKPYPNFVDFVQQYNLVNSEGDVSFRNGKKPEEYIKYYIEMFTEDGDIVLDYHLGSGTTAAVAHKMNRQYIGIEQMDYIETVSVERLKKVIAGEQGGISKDVNWSGGGSFVYAELKNDAQDFKNAIFEATTTEELLELFELAKKSSFLSYRIDPKKLKKNKFSQLSLAEQKQILSEIIDNNNLYVNYSDIDDNDYQISAEDKKLNHSFYGKEK
ncbi:TPA: site-specific DNA-methyltransferase [Streptococcus suis]|nr:site-specific DNA-methyltransferase [Streptococcus suis]HEM3120179.1 site-specific DNA-methyltransferase [Streptococcus suis]HEM3134369.1 site-specific DNA-methyltransferase [Streptococcus suis]HEM3158570.1 site-specific DNA-methyltransferase [Streptococcus suis]HEM6529858.1 site-specific DNA-methyltransferase [Streptococcus suis]